MIASLKYLLLSARIQIYLYMIWLNAIGPHRSLELVKNPLRMSNRTVSRYTNCLVGFRSQHIHFYS
jgi:hypothetical protein